MRLGLKWIVAGLIAINGMTAVALEAVPWHTDLESAFQVAGRENRPLLLHFWTPDCGPCLRLEKHVFNRKSVAETLDDFFVPVKINATQHPNIAARYKVNRYPTDVILGPDDSELHRMITPQNAQQYISQLSAVAFRSGLVPRNRINPRDNHFASLNDRQVHAVGSQQVIPRQAEDPPREIRNQFVNHPENQGATGSRDSIMAANRHEKRNPYVDQNAPGGRYDSAAKVGYDAYEQKSTLAVENYEHQSQINNRQVTRERQRPNLNRQVPAQSPQIRKGPQIGLDGFCPVSLLRKDVWAKGDPRWGVIHRGRTYLFASKAEKDEFFARPDEYSPVLSGIDPVQLTESGRVVDGKRAHGVVYRKRVYLFASEQNLQKFWSDPDKFSGTIQQAMQTANSKIYR